MSLMATTANAAGYGIEISKRGFPSVAGQDDPGQYWIAGTAVVTPTAEQPDMPVRPGTAYKGTAVLATSPTGLVVVISSGADPTKGVVLQAGAGEYTARAEGSQGLFTKRPRLIEVETADWILALAMVDKVLTSSMTGRSEAALLSALHRTARR